MSAPKKTFVRNTRMRRRSSLLIGALALTLAATACGGGDDDDSSSDGKDKNAGPPTDNIKAESQAPAKPGGTLTMLAVQDSQVLDVFRTSNVAVADEPRLAALYDPLFYIDNADHKVKPHLGESLTTADNGKTWTMKLRAGAQFSDGTPLDAAAVKMNYDMHGEAKTGSLHRSAAGGLKTEVVDPTTVRMTPAMPNAQFDRVLAIELTYIEAPSALSAGPDVYGAKPVGAGPFMLKSWTRGSEQVFVKNPNYWQKDKGLPKLDGFTVKNVPDIQQQYNTVNSGSADLFFSSDQAVLTKAAKELNTRVLKAEGGQMFQFNLTRPPFNDPRARRAVALAMDPADIGKTLNNGYIPATGFFPETSQFYDPAIKQPTPDKAEAQKLFNELAAEGKKVDFTYLLPQNPSSVKVAEYMQAQLQAYENVTMKLQPVEIGAYIVKYAIQKDFQAMLFQNWNVDPEPVMFNSFFSKSPQNFVGWNNPQADQALLTGRNSTDPAARKAAYTELQKAMVADLPIWVYAQSWIGPISNSKVTGIEQYNTGVAFMDRIGFK
jgi:peptide/nickel transport system substrate-binding protein